MSFTDRIKALFNEHEVSIESVVEAVEEIVTEDVKYLDLPYGEDRVFRIEGGELAVDAYIAEVVTEEVEGEVKEVTKQIEDGEYLLDGKKVVIGNDLIVSIEEESTEEEVIVEDAPAEEMFKKTVTESFEKMKSEFDLMLKTVKDLTETNAKLEEELVKVKSDFSTELEEIKKLPAERGVSFKKQGFKSVKKENDYTRLQDLSSKYRK